MPFELELTDQHRRLWQQFSEDFWRREVVHNPDLAQLAFAHGLTPTGVLSELHPYINKPYLHSTLPADTLAHSQHMRQQAWQNVRHSLPELAAQFTHIHPHINNNIYSVFKNDENLPGVNEFMKKYVAIPSGWWVNL